MSIIIFSPFTWHYLIINIIIRKVTIIVLPICAVHLNRIIFHFRSLFD